MSLPYNLSFETTECYELPEPTPTSRGSIYRLDFLLSILDILGAYPRVPLDTRFYDIYPVFTLYTINLFFSWFCVAYFVPFARHLSGQQPIGFEPQSTLNASQILPVYLLYFFLASFSHAQKWLSVLQ